MITIGGKSLKYVGALLVSVCAVGLIASMQQKGHLAALLLSVEARPVVDKSIVMSIEQLGQPGLDLDRWRAQALKDLEQANKVQGAVHQLVDQANRQQRLAIGLWGSMLVAEFLLLLLYWRRQR